MQTLREATAPQHAQLEEAIDIQGQLRTPDAYRELIGAFYGFVRPIEACLARQDWSKVGVDFQTRQKARLLEEDLVALGVSPATVQQCNELPDVSSISRAFGAFYVMEGSTLGGQQITRIANKAGIEPGALNYFRSYGERVGEMWRTFGSALNDFAAKGRQVAEMSDAAQETFEALRLWFLSKRVCS